MKYQGFTLIELLVTIAVAAVLLTVGIPSFIDTIHSNRVTTQANDFVTALNLTRSEAVKQGRTATLCIGNGDLTDCSTAKAWKDGWLIWVDVNGDGALGDEDTIVRTYPALHGKSTMTASGGAKAVAYIASGFLSGASVDFTLSETGCQNSNARLISVKTPTGRPAVSKTACP
jgi:type IV fimbrial biogenesis protein FimT